jgi:cytochrome c553
MYHAMDISPLSKKQVSKLLNAHPVRIKAGSGAKIHLCVEHSKKLHRAGLKGSAITVTLDPYAIEHNQHLRDAVGMVRKGTGPKGLKKFQKWTAAIGDVLKPVAKPILEALTDQAVNNINAYGDAASSKASMGMGVKKKKGTGPKGLKKFQKWTDAIGDVLKPVAKPILSALTDQAVNSINAYGDAASSKASMGMGVKKGKGRSKRAKSESPKHKPKRVMSEAQKAALAKGRHALRLKLNEMGAGAKKKKHSGKALMPAGY